MHVDSFSIIWEFKVTSAKVKELTRLLETGDDSVRTFTIKSTVSRDAINLFCDYLEGKNITITDKTYDDIKLLSREMQCTSLDGMLKSFEDSRENHIDSKLNEISRQIHTMLIASYQCGHGCNLAKTEFSRSS